MNAEKWQHIKGYEGLYEVSNLGRVRALRRTVACGIRRITKPPVLMKTAVSDRGYERLQLSKNGLHKFHRVHRLVAEAFLAEQPAGMQINHKNLNKRDNCATNLEWVTPQENTHHAHLNGRGNAGEKHGACKLKACEVEAIRSAYGAGGITQKLLAEQYGVSRSLISMIVGRFCWKGVAS